MVTVAKLVIKLKELEKALIAQTDVRKFSEIWDWQAPSLNKDDLYYHAKLIRLKIEAVDWEISPDDNQEIIDDYVEKAQLAISRHANQLMAGPNAPISMIAFLNSLELHINDLISDDQVKGVLALPLDMKKRVRAAEKQLAASLEALQGIGEKLAEIKDAHDAASNLGTTLSELEDAIQQAEKAKATVDGYSVTSKASSDGAEAFRSGLEKSASEAEAIMKRVQAAYRAATSEGLSKSFAEKAERLNLTLFPWAAFLFLSLGIAGWLSYHRFPEILAAASGTPEWKTVFVHAALGLLTVGPPLWVAWVSTMQIGQRFRLAEDYAYKASLAAAYEGYRAEAVQLDPMFAHQLFAIALNRLDELPLRLVDKHVSGSPLHELFKSAEFKSAVENVPGLKERVLAAFQAIRPSKQTEEKADDE